MGCGDTVYPVERGPFECARKMARRSDGLTVLTGKSNNHPTLKPSTSGMTKLTTTRTYTAWGEREQRTPQQSVLPRIDEQQEEAHGVSEGGQVPK